MEQRKYTSIVRMGHRDTVGVVKEGDYITVYEKLDGANASFTLGDGGEVLAFSRNTPLTSENTLRGFYGYAMNLPSEDMDPEYIYYGEWLVKHKVDYGEHSEKFYLFDVYDLRNEEYLPVQEVIREALTLGIPVAPIMYQGPYISFEHLSSLVGRSVLAKSGVGEGIVVKNPWFKDRYGRQVFMKLVSDGFREMQPQKAPRDPNTPETVETAFVKTYLTEARVDKLLRKLVDEAVIPESFELEDMGVILRELGGRVYDDLLKEESAELPADFEEKGVRKAIGKLIPGFVREIIKGEVAA